MRQILRVFKGEKAKNSADYILYQNQIRFRHSGNSTRLHSDGVASVMDLTSGEHVSCFTTMLRF